MTRGADKQSLGASLVHIIFPYCAAANNCSGGAGRFEDAFTPGRMRLWIHARCKRDADTCIVYLDVFVMLRIHLYVYASKRLL